MNFLKERLNEFHKQALLKKYQENESQDGRGITTRRQAAAQARVDQPLAPETQVEGQPPQASSVSQSLLDEPQSVSDHEHDSQASEEPIASTSNHNQTKKLPFQREELLFENENLKIFVVKSDLKRWVTFKMLDHQFILRVEV